MALVDARGFNLGADITGEAKGFTQLLGQGQVVQSQEMALQQQRAQLEREAQVRQALSGGAQMQPQTEQEQMIAEQSAGLGGALAQAEQPQPMTFEEKKRMARDIDPAIANKILKEGGLDDASKRAEASRFASDLENTPFELRGEKIEARIQNLISLGRNPSDTAQLRDLTEEQQNQALLGVQLADLNTQQRFGVKEKQRATGPKIGTFNPRDYTVDSFAKFRETNDPSVLVRHTEKTVDIGGVPHRLVPGTTNQYEPIKTTKQVATSKAEIAGAISKAKAEAKDQGETFTGLKQARAALPGLKSTVDQLRELAPIATSTLGGKIFNAAVKETGFGATKGATARAKFIAIINNQVLPLLKPTFGAAFTVQEGESLKATMGDPDSSPEEKMAQLDAFIEQKMRDIETKEAVLQEAPQTTADKPTILKFNPLTGKLE